VWQILCYQIAYSMTKRTMRVSKRLEHWSTPSTSSVNPTIIIGEAVIFGISWTPKNHTSLTQVRGLHVLCLLLSSCDFLDMLDLLDLLGLQRHCLDLLNRFSAIKRTRNLFQGRAASFDKEEEHCH